MRLIDADKLDEDVLYWNMHDDPKQKDYDTRDIEDVLREQPTVEAIPVEWIKNKIAVNVHLWEEGKEKMFVEDGVFKIVSYSLTAQTLSQLLELWEAENE